MIAQLWGNDEPPVVKKTKQNPCIKLYGAGPTGARCATCVHLLTLDWHSKTYRKCELRDITHSPRTDHSSRFLACGKYETKQNNEQ